MRKNTTMVCRRTHDEANDIINIHNIRQIACPYLVYIQQFLRLISAILADTVLVIGLTSSGFG